MAENQEGADQASVRKSVAAPALASVVKPEDVVGTPEEHAAVTGNAPAAYKGPLETAPTQLTFNGKQERARFSVAHECAAILHGWAEHEHHADEPIKLSRKDYELALKAATEPYSPPVCPKRGHVLGDPDPVRHAQILRLNGSPIPHEPALSPHAAAAHRQILELSKAVAKTAESAK